MAATQPAVVEGASALQAVDQVFEVPVDMVEVADRIRPVDPMWAAALGQMMLRDTQQEPIKVCQLPGRTKLRLVVGAHRLEGRRLTGQPTVRAILVSADALSRRLAEVSENLFKGDLAPLDRAKSVAELVELHKMRAGIDPGASAQSVAAKARWAQALKADAADATAIIANAYGWSAEVGAQLGLSDRTIRGDLLLHRRLAPDVAAKLRDTPVARNAAQLQALAKLAEDDQRAAAGLIADGKAKGTSDALAILQQKVAPSAEAKRLSAFIGSFERMGQAEKRAALQMLAKLKLPQGVAIEVASATNG